MLGAVRRVDPLQEPAKSRPILTKNNTARDGAPEPKVAATRRGHPACFGWPVKLETATGCGAYCGEDSTVWKRCRLSSIKTSCVPPIKRHGGPNAIVPR